MIRGLIAALAFTLVSSPSFGQPAEVDGDRIAECYGAYDALVTLGERKKLSEAETATFSASRAKAQARAVALYQTEGLNEELAREQLEGRALFMRSEFRELSEAGGVYGLDDMRKLASQCDGLLVE